jgi:hypothetical protein
MKLSFHEFAKMCDFQPAPYQQVLFDLLSKGKTHLFIERPRSHGGYILWELQLNEMRERWLQGETTQYVTLQQEDRNRPRVIYDELEFAKAYLNQWYAEEE